MCVWRVAFCTYCRALYHISHKYAVPLYHIFGTTVPHIHTPGLLQKSTHFSRNSASVSVLSTTANIFRYVHAVFVSWFCNLRFLWNINRIQVSFNVEIFLALALEIKLHLPSCTALIYFSKTMNCGCSSHEVVLHVINIAASGDIFYIQTALSLIPFT
jgi:hypothetical protein